MKVLFDEGVPPYLRRELAGHTIVTMNEMGWAGQGIPDSKLLEMAAAEGFDVLLTNDKRLEAQQNPGLYGIEICALTVSHSDRYNVRECFKTQMPTFQTRLDELQERRHFTQFQAEFREAFAGLAERLGLDLTNEPAPRLGTPREQRPSQELEQASEELRYGRGLRRGR